MLERACLAVEQAAAGGGVFPEVLFEVARHWYEMSEETSPTTALLDAQGSNRAQPGSVTQRHDLDNSPVMGVATSATVTQVEECSLCYCHGDMQIFSFFW